MMRQGRMEEEAKQRELDAEFEVQHVCNLLCLRLSLYQRGMKHLVPTDCLSSGVFFAVMDHNAAMSFCEAHFFVICRQRRPRCKSKRNKGQPSGEQRD